MAGRQYEVRAIYVENNKAHYQTTYDDFHDLKKAREQIDIWQNHYGMNICYYEIVSYKLSDRDHKRLVERKILTKESL